jgi:hypothetical protein
MMTQSFYVLYPVFLRTSGFYYSIKPLFVCQCLEKTLKHELFINLKHTVGHNLEWVREKHS